MTTRDEVHALVDRVPEDDLPALLESVRQLLLPQLVASGPRSLGMGHSGYSDSSERVDEILRETGFGE